MNTTRFFYISVGQGMVTAAIVQHEQTNTYRVGLAFMSPKDQLNKKRGRTIALGRLQTQRRFCGSFEAEDELVLHKLDTWLHELLVDSSVPSWARGQRAVIKSPFKIDAAD